MKHQTPVLRLTAVLVLWACGLASADLQLNGLFTDHMVMQRGMPVPVWGWAEPGEDITVTIDQQAKTTKANDAGKWMVRLDAMDVGQPRTMTVKGKTESKAVADILLGEVWLCGGQSNMQWNVSQSKDAAREIAAANMPSTRLFNLVRGGANRSPDGKPMDQIPDGKKGSGSYKEAWQVCSPASVKDDFSAVGFFFGRELHAKLNVPVGLISNPVGGSAIEMWISRQAFERDQDYRHLTAFHDRLVEFAQTLEGQKEVQQNVDDYDAKQKELKAAGKPAMWPTKHPGAPKRDGFTSAWFNSRVNPLVPFAMRGAIWYQGEANGYKPDKVPARGSEYTREYEHLLPLMIKDWRNHWGQGDFPFLIVQLPNWSKPRPEPNQSGWTTIREAQLRTWQSVPNTGMAVTIDVGEVESIHPLNKQPVGERLALVARAIAYGEKIEYSGPIYREMKVEGGKVRLFFDHIGGGLEARGGELKQFAVAGADGKLVWAKAEIDGDTVLVHAEEVPNPTIVHYATATNPDGCNLFNKAGLPASPFRTNGPAPQERGLYYKNKLKEKPTLRPPK